MTGHDAGSAGATGNTIKPARKRSSEPARSLEKGDVPSSVLDRYLIERDRRGRAERFFRDHRAAAPAFRDQGRRLETSRAYPDTISDMLKIAEHRGWRRIRVEGEADFRRDVWIQARARGLEVDGYRPRERDRQAAGEPAARAGSEAVLRSRLDRAAAVVRHIVPDAALARKLVSEALERALERVKKDRPGPERARSRGR
ncbi:LPD7 domain-containing protein [Brevundimonas sp. FT23042]|uniref:LPD7 domain-containing protein n=1 Tax=Brevundimonas sp. FT23042 TaxID=3393749 RepID=UPI003B587DC8